MTKKRGINGKRADSDASGHVFDLIEREITPDQQRLKFIEQDERFCAAMRKAIAVGAERPK